MLNKTPYELFKGRKPNISYFYLFGCTCYTLNNKVHLNKVDAKVHMCTDDIASYDIFSYGFSIFLCI